MSYGYNEKEYSLCEVLSIKFLNDFVFKLKVKSEGITPKAGQFYMIKTEYSSVLLGRPIGIYTWSESSLQFLIEIRGKATKEFSALKIGEKVKLLGPLGNAWSDMPSGEGAIALVSGGAGIAPLSAFTKELNEKRIYDFYAGFKTISFGLENISPRSLIVTSEDGSAGEKGLITNFIKHNSYSAIYACGNELMLKSIAYDCKKLNVPCYISMGKYMACGVGACLGCTVKTANGNKTCCSSGPIFKADEVIFDE